MSLRGFQVASLLALLVGWASHGITGLIVVGLVILAGFWIGVRLHPRVTHRGCNGKGEFPGRILGWRTHRCGHCDGGQILPWTTGMLGTDHQRRLYRTRLQARAQARRTHTDR